MTDIKTGDWIKFKNQHRSDAVRTVTAVGELTLLYKTDLSGIGGGTEHVVAIEDVEKIEPWFEVGKKYRHVSGKTPRECVAVGEHDGTPWAVFDAPSSDGPLGFWAADMDAFEEVTE